MAQFEAWELVTHLLDNKMPELNDFWSHTIAQRVLISGCGTSYYLAITAAFILSSLHRVQAMALPASELFIFPEVYLAQRPDLLLVFSRSGETSEVLKAVEVYKSKKGGKVLAITCRNDSPLARMADLALSIPEAEDKSVVQTRSFTTMFLTFLGLVLLTAKKHEWLKQLSALPALARDVVLNYHMLLQEVASTNRFTKFIFLGSGWNYGLACTAMLNLKEMSLSNTEAYHFMEFRHGPCSSLDPNTLVIGLISTKNKEHERLVLKQASFANAHVLAFADTTLPEAHYNIVVDTPELCDYARSLAFFPCLHLLSFYKALAQNVDPDSPPHLKRVVILEGGQGEN